MPQKPFWDFFVLIGQCTAISRREERSDMRIKRTRNKEQEIWKEMM
jgi:hypothetical protein